MGVRYTTQCWNRDGIEGHSFVPGGIDVRVTSPETGSGDRLATNPEQLIGLAWATCLNATAQVLVAGRRRTAVRVDVELHDAPNGPGYEFHLTAVLSAEGLEPERSDHLLARAHARCPVSKLLREATTVQLRTEPYESR